MGPSKKKQKPIEKPKQSRDAGTQEEEFDPYRIQKVRCRVLQQRIWNKILTTMEFNDLGVAISEEKCLWASWAGKTVRTRLDIKYVDWRKVPMPLKIELYVECKVTISFNYEIILLPCLHVQFYFVICMTLQLGYMFVDY